MILTGSALREYLQRTPPLVENLIDPSLQLQGNGIELTVMTVERIIEDGSIGFDDRERRLPKTKEMRFNANGWMHLSDGCYKVTFNELVNIPLDVFAIARPRSSLLRMGVTVETALWDSGYSGRSESLLIVYNKRGFNVRKGARLVQLIFFKLPSALKEGYTGRYRGENIEEQLGFEIPSATYGEGRSQDTKVLREGGRDE